jgi:hypothetical protein
VVSDLKTKYVLIFMFDANLAIDPVFASFQREKVRETVSFPKIF